MKTSVVVFDAAGVLFPLNRVVGEELQRRYGLTVEQLAPFWSDGLYRQLTLGQLNTEEFLSAFADAFELPRESVTEEVFVDSFEGALTPMPGVRQILERLVEEDVHLALLSDTVKMYADIRHQHGYYKYFEKLFFSYETGVSKPDPRAFQNVIEYYKVPAGEIFFVDDQPANVQGALDQGLRAVVFKDADELEQTLAEEGVL